MPMSRHARPRRPPPASRVMAAAIGEGAARQAQLAVALLQTTVESTGAAETDRIFCKLPCSEDRSPNT